MAKRENIDPPQQKLVCHTAGRSPKSCCVTDLGGSIVEVPDCPKLSFRAATRDCQSAIAAYGACAEAAARAAACAASAEL